MNILVIGGTGFIGTRIVQALREQAGWNVSVGSRQPSSAADKRVQVDVTNPSQLQQALAGFSVVVNCSVGDAATIRDGAKALGSACKHNGTQVLVHLSSMAVYGAVEGVVTESAPLRRDAGWYGHAKADAEELLQVALKGTNTRLCLLRPGCVYGPGSEQWTARIARLLEARRIGDLGVLGDGHSNLVEVSDVAQAVKAAIEKPNVAGAFNLAAPDSGTWNQYFIAFGRALSATPIRRIPGWRIKLESKLFAYGLKVLEIVARKVPPLRRLSVPEPMPPSLTGVWQQDLHLDQRRATVELELAWVQTTTGIQRSAKWWQATSR
jgi:nucleoside-diphosphate-sugar epimerase